MMTETKRRQFMVWPDDTVEELVGDDTVYAKAPGIYSALIVNGLPITGGDPADRWSTILDFAIGEHGTVTAYTNGPAPHEHPIPGEAVKPLTDWLALREDEELS